MEWLPRNLVVVANARHRRAPGHVRCGHTARSSSLVVVKSNLVRFAPKFSSFFMVGPSSLARSGGVVPGMGCMVLQPLCRWKEHVVSRLLGCNR
jgi:hypothetical protein